MTIEECYSKLGCTPDYWKMVLTRLHLDTAKSDKIATYVVKHMKPDGLWDDTEILIAAKKNRLTSNQVSDILYSERENRKCLRVNLTI